MDLTVGMALHSASHATAVIVIRVPAEAVSVTCGGEPMSVEKPGAPTFAPASD